MTASGTIRLPAAPPLDVVPQERPVLWPWPIGVVVLCLVPLGGLVQVFLLDFSLGTSEASRYKDWLYAPRAVAAVVALLVLLVAVPCLCVREFRTRARAAVFAGAVVLAGLALMLGSVRSTQRLHDDASLVAAVASVALPGAQPGPLTSGRHTEPVETGPGIPWAEQDWTLAGDVCASIRDAAAEAGVTLGPEECSFVLVRHGVDVRVSSDKPGLVVVDAAPPYED